MSKWTVAVLLASMSASGCFADDSTDPGVAGGSGGVGASGGSGGATGGTGGSSATGGSSGSGGSSGTGGQSGAGGSNMDASSTGGSAGVAGSAGAGGSGGTGGAAGSGGAAGTAGAAGGTGGASGSGGAGDATVEPIVCVQGTGPTALPFAVDEFFTPTGWMGDITAIQMDGTSCGPVADAGASDAGASDARAPDAGADARGPDAGTSDAGTRIPTAKCWTVTYTPGDGGQGWAGVDWQFPNNNWGPMIGRVIPRGAKHVRFYAWGDTGAEVVSFNVGYGFTSPDTFGMTLANQILTTTPTAYEIDLTGIDYTCPSVRMGFGWTTAGTVPVKFHVDDVEWQ
ncbi:MAG TPA: hypothetical protein VK550_09365 [Polyangiaceae bacterium]|nr:hypothetical protein [Polyangiaceae bacterium]